MKFAVFEVLPGELESHLNGKAISRLVSVDSTYLDEGGLERPTRISVGQRFFVRPLNALIEGIYQESGMNDWYPDVGYMRVKYRVVWFVPE